MMRFPLLAILFTGCGVKAYHSDKSAPVQLWDNCGARCAEGTQTPLNPTVWEAVVAHPRSMSRVHLSAAAHYIADGEPAPASLLSPLAIGWPNASAQIDWISQQQQGFLTDHGGMLLPGQPGSAAPHGDGELMARALARAVHDDAQAMITDLGRAQVLTGLLWDADNRGAHKFPLSCQFAPDQGAMTVEIACTPTTEGKAAWETVAMLDVSGVEGAFDVGAALNYDTVVGQIREQ